ncbi:MAG: RNA 3'-terminal-phosphate cyclase [Nitrospirae bacterium RBG_13_43_8]|nr:MAG: RNA 3'-terminal-phosphate cyclase [Nitrospirae bacterium RBG_13_43_8]
MLEIDGSFGEGGGQILRTSLSLSCLLNKPFRLFNIRRRRKKPGLMPQHLMGIRSLKLISNARVDGDFQGSTELVFEPGEVKAGDYFFDIGTAGSTSLLLQAILPPLIFANNRSSLTLKGGTHVPLSPPFHYINKIFIPVMNKLGIKVKAAIESYGFYPKGGGKVHAEIKPIDEIAPVNYLERGEFKNVYGFSGVGNLPLSIAERQKNAALSILASRGVNAEIETISVSTPGQGTFIFLEAETENCLAGFFSLGERGKKAELVGEEAAKEFLDYYSASACLDRNLADQIVLYLAISKGESSFTTTEISGHLLTNLWVIEKFLGIRYTIEGEMGRPGKVTINPLFPS